MATREYYEEAGLIMDSQRENVRVTENAFAQTMLDRDLQRFASFIDEQAIFIGDEQVLRGKEAIVKGWRDYFNADSAPFTWQAQTVEVLANGQLARSLGPVFNPQGHLIAHFDSVWQRNEAGQWKIVFDKGYPVTTTQSI